MGQENITCELHDIIEIACMYGYYVQLLLKNDQILEGKAVDITTSTEKREYLIIDNGQEQQQVELTQLTKMSILTQNAQFKEVNF